MNERQTLFSAPGWAPASGTTAPRVEPDLVAEVLGQLPVSVLLVHPSGVVAFANEAARQSIDRASIVGNRLECVLAPLQVLQALEQEQGSVGFAVSKVERREGGNLHAVVVHDMPRARALLEARNGKCDGPNADGICGVCWEQNLLELVGRRGPSRKEEAVEFSKVVVEQNDTVSNEVAAPIPPPPTWRADDRDFDQLVEDGAEALLTKKFEVALEAYEAAARMRPDAPNIHMIQGNLERLRELVGDPNH